MKFNRRVKRIIAISTLTFFIVVAIKVLFGVIAMDVGGSYRNSRAIAQANSNAQTEVYPRCFPESVSDIQYFGGESLGDSEYKYWSYISALDGSYQEMVSIETPSLCGASYSSWAAETITTRIPLSVARALTKQKFETIIDEDFDGDPEAYEDEVLDVIKVDIVEDLTTPTYIPKLTSVEVWVLGEVGIELPEPDPQCMSPSASSVPDDPTYCYQIMYIDEDYKY